MLLQKEVDIGPDDTVGSLYFDKLFPLGVEAMVESVDLVAGGNAPSLVQDEPQATYEGWCRKEDVTIDWSLPLNEIYNLVRGGDPQPGAVTSFQGKELQLFRARKHEGAAAGASGEVVDVSGDGFAISAPGGTLFVGRVQPEGGSKVVAPEWMESVGLKVGDKLGE